MPVNPQKAIAKWQARMGSAAADIKDGVMNVTVAPTQKAAEQVAKYADGCAKAASDGTFVNGCNSVTLQDWQRSMTDKGADNAARGARTLSAKAQRNMADLIAFSQQTSAQIQAMPNKTESDAEARMLANVKAMRGYAAMRKG